MIFATLWPMVTTKYYLNKKLRHKNKDISCNNYRHVINKQYLWQNIEHINTWFIDISDRHFMIQFYKALQWWQTTGISTLYQLVQPSNNRKLKPPHKYFCGESTGDLSQMAINAGSASISWRHHEFISPASTYIIYLCHSGIWAIESCILSHVNCNLHLSTKEFK